METTWMPVFSGDYIQPERLTKDAFAKAQTKALRAIAEHMRKNGYTRLTDFDHHKVFMPERGQYFLNFTAAVGKVAI
jgi:hypothetical protein